MKKCNHPFFINTSFDYISNLEYLCIFVEVRGFYFLLLYNLYFTIPISKYHCAFEAEKPFGILSSLHALIAALFVPRAFVVSI